MFNQKSVNKMSKSDLLEGASSDDVSTYRGDVIEEMNSKSGHDRFGEFVKSGEIAYLDLSRAENARNFIEDIVSCSSVSVSCSGFNAKKSLKVGFYSHSMTVREIKNLVKRAEELTGERCGQNMYFLSNDLADEVLFPLSCPKGREQFNEMLACKCSLIVCDADSVIYEPFGTDWMGYKNIAGFVKEMKAAGKAVLILDSSGASKKISMNVDVVLELVRPKKTGRSYHHDDLVMTVKKSPQPNMRGKVLTYSSCNNNSGRAVWQETLSKHYSQSVDKKNIDSIVNQEVEDEIVVFKQKRK